MLAWPVHFQNGRMLPADDSGAPSVPMSMSQWWHLSYYLEKKDYKYRNFPGGPVIKSVILECRAMGPIPGGETKTLLAKQTKQKQQIPPPKTRNLIVAQVFFPLNRNQR